MSRTFASLSVGNYRLYFFGALLSNTGTWMGRVAQDWLVLTQLTDHSASVLGIVTALAWAPFLIFAPLAGVLADRWSKRQILLWTQSLLGVTNLVLAVLVLTGRIELWHVMVLSFVQGCVTTLDNPARQAFVSEMVGQDLVGNAVGLNSASFNLGRLVGPAVAGLMIAAVDVGPALAVNAVSFGAVVVALCLMDRRGLHPAPQVRGKGRLREGMAYVRGRPDILVVMFLVFVLGTFGMNFQLTNALMATKEFGRGPADYGMLGSVMAIGSLAAALWTARRSRPRLRVLLGSLAGFAASTAALAAAPTFAVFSVLLVPVGLCALTALTTANAMVQLSTEPTMRGRVMGLYMWIFIGGTPVGAPIIGRIADAFGARWSILVGSIAVGASVAVVAIYLRRSENLRVTLDLHRPGWLRIERGGAGAPPDAADVEVAVEAVR